MYNDFYGTSSTDSLNALAGAGTVAGLLIVGMLIFSLILSLITIISYWKIFKKANKSGWAAIIPIYNIIVMLEIAELPIWYIILYFIPFANIYALFKVNIEIAKKFGKSAGFGIGMSLIPIIFIPMLAFSDNQYKGTVNSSTTSNSSFDATSIINNGSINNNIQTQQMDNNIPLQNNIEIAPVMNTEPSINTVENNIATAPVMNTEPSINTVENNIVTAPVMNTEPTINTVENNIDAAPYEVVEVSNDSNLNNSIPIVEPVQNTIVEPSVETIQSEQPAIELEANTVNAFNTTPIINNSIDTVTEPINNLQENNVVNDVIAPTAQDIPITDVVIDLSEQKKICKNCGRELPNIVSICPNCGTDNE